tara:strand:+ start:200 stop:394 length:195 start_codon:yes stop_codon:yes gene_type:complete
MEKSSLTLKEIMSLRNDIEIRDKLALALGKAEERIGELESIIKRLSNYVRMEEYGKKGEEVKKK